jgi:hypothetical protein
MEKMKSDATDPVPLSAEEALALTEIPIELKLDQYGSGKFEIRFKNLTEKAKFLASNYHLNLDDMAVMKKELVIKKTGKYKYAAANGLECTKVDVVEANYERGIFLVKAKVFFKGIETPFEDLGLCERNEPGRNNQTNATILETASTRAICRAIGIHLPMSIQDQPTEEQIEKDIEQKMTAEAERIYQKKVEAQEKSAEIKQTQQTEAKLIQPALDYNRKVKATKKAKEVANAIDDLLAAHPQDKDDYSEPPDGVDVE